MKVLHIFRGFEDYMIEILNIQADIFETHVVIPKSSDWIKAHLEKNVIVAGISPKNVKSLKNLYYTIQLVIFIWRLKPDVIHIQSGVIWEIAVYLIFKNRIKITTTIHDVTCHPTQDNSSDMQKWINLSIKYSDAIVAHTDEAKKTILCNYNQKNVLKIPHPIIKQYHPKNTPKENYKIIFFGTLDKWKGLEVFEQAINLLKDLPIAVEIRGNSKFKEYYRELFSKHQNVRLDIRRQSKEDIEQLFNSGAVLVLPYIEASQSGVLHIAIHFKIPVIASRIGGIKELIEQHQIAIGFEPGNAEDLANKIKTFFENKNEEISIKENQTNYETNHASQRAIGIAYMDIYHNTLSKNA